MDGARGHSTAEYIEIDHPWISNDSMPVYRWTFPPEATDDELSACFRARNDWATRVRYCFAWIIDVSNVTRAAATQRKALAEHLKSHEAFSEQWNAGSALIVPNAWLRGLVTAVFWVSPPSYPHETFSEPIEAERWASKQLAMRLARLD